MKAIMTFEDTYYTMFFSKAIKTIDEFLPYVIKRACELLPIDEEEAKSIIEDDGNDSITFSQFHGNATAIISHDYNTEYIQTVDIPESTLEVYTSAGIIRANKCDDPGQPGIAITLRPAGYDDEIDVSYVSVYEDPAYREKDGDERDVDVCIMTYADASKETYTKKDVIRREDIMKALD